MIIALGVADALTAILFCLALAKKPYCSLSFSHTHILRNRLSTNRFAIKSAVWFAKMFKHPHRSKRPGTERETISPQAVAPGNGGVSLKSAKPPPPPPVPPFGRVPCLQATFLMAIKNVCKSRI